MSNTTITTNWWHPDNNDLAQQLSVGILNELKHRITHTNIKREKLQLHESSERIRQLFQREIARYTKRLDAAAKKKQDVERVDMYRAIARRLLECNLSLARKCLKNKIPIEKVVVHGKATCYR
jgi:hypothetical protein